MCNYPIHCSLQGAKQRLEVPLPVIISHLLESPRYIAAIYPRKPNGGPIEEYIPSTWFKQRGEKIAHHDKSCLVVFERSSELMGIGVSGQGLS